MDREFEYTIISQKTAQTDVYYHTLCEDIRGYLSGKTEDEVIKISNRIGKCLCGSDAELHEYEGMGEGSYVICCKSCDRTLERGPYDVDIKKWEEVLEFCIRDWNAGLSSEDIQKMNEDEHKRLKLRQEDLKWKEYHPNNMVQNPLEGYYSLVFAWIDDKLYCCKWTIRFQYEEIEPMYISSDSPIEAYNLFMVRIFEVKGPMGYPPLSRESAWRDNEDVSFPADGVNDAGDFIRSYKTLEDAKLGAVSRCGWQGINRDTILKEEDYIGKSAEEIELLFKKKGR